MKNNINTKLKYIRYLTLFIIFGLIISGITAFPLLYELNILASFFVNESLSFDPSEYSGLSKWIITVPNGLDETYSKFPFIRYGTDWLAFMLVFRLHSQLLH